MGQKMQLSTKPTHDNKSGKITGGASKGYLSELSGVINSSMSSPDRLTTKSLEFPKRVKALCRFCGGKSCSKENWKKCQQPAIKGLHSNWVTKDIIASQRLSNRLIEEYDIMQQFKEAGVKAVLNLEEPGEHPFCGDGIYDHKVGFAYNP